MPTVLAYAEQPIGQMRDLLGGLLPVLPRRFYVADVLADDYRIQAHGSFQKMAPIDQSWLIGLDCSAAVALWPADTEELQALYGASYPGNFFVSRMLETGFYFGIRRGGALVSVAGVPVYSPRYKVAALRHAAWFPRPGVGKAEGVI